MQVPLEKPPNSRGIKHQFPVVQEAPLSLLNWDYEELPDRCGLSEQVLCCCEELFRHLETIWKFQIGTCEALCVVDIHSSVVLQCSINYVLSVTST